jgi:hypothetical protein
VADAKAELNELRAALDEANEKIGLLMQPRSGEALEDGVWRMLQLWIANRKSEKQAERKMLKEVTDERDRLATENDERRAALEPFAAWAASVVPPLRRYGDDYVCFDNEDANDYDTEWQITKGDLKRAAALATKKDPP